MKIVSTVILFLALIPGCDQSGLNPDEYQEPGFSGTITFTGTIPPSDSLRDLRIVAVPYYPVDTTFAELFDKIVNKGIIPFSESLSGTAAANSTVVYVMNVKPQEYRYVAVVQMYGINFLNDWRVVSVFGYTPSDPNPKTVTVSDGIQTRGVNFVVDFYSLPTQPFKLP
jgi:hypothetical protein